MTILGHPPSRLLLSRKGDPLNISDIIEATHVDPVAMKVNVSPYRIDLDWRYCKLVKEAGAWLSPNPGTH